MWRDLGVIRRVLAAKGVVLSAFTAFIGDFKGLKVGKREEFGSFSRNSIKKPQISLPD